MLNSLMKHYEWHDVEWMNNKVKIEVPIDITFNMECLLEDIIKEAKTQGYEFKLLDEFK